MESVPIGGAALTVRKWDWVVIEKITFFAACFHRRREASALGATSRQLQYRTRVQGCSRMSMISIVKILELAFTAEASNRGIKCFGPAPVTDGTRIRASSWAAGFPEVQS